jgi:hypothetical protein
MANDDINVGPSPTVMQVIDQFIARMRSDDGIEGRAIDRLEKLLNKPTVPKHDEIYTALFESPSDGDA